MLDWKGEYSMARYRLVIVHWEDAWGCSGGYTKAELMREKAARVATVGYVVRSDRKCIVLAHRAQRKAGEWKDITFIPRVYIRKVSPYRHIPGRKLPVCRVDGTFNCP